MTKKFVLSTMTQSVKFNIYGYPEDERMLPYVKRSILIHGGANLPSAKSGFGDVSNTAEGAPIWTAAGIITPVSDEDLALLMQQHVFKSQIENGYLKVINDDIRGNHRDIKRAVAADMEPRDNFAPLTKGTVEGRIKVHTQTASNEDNRL